MGLSVPHTWTIMIIFTLWFLNNFVFAGRNELKLPPEGNEATEAETKLAHHGVSRFDVSGILTAFGVKQGASIFALVLFPILFPLMILLALALFIISMFGTGGTLAAVGRRSDIIANSNGDSFGYTSLLPGGGGGGVGGVGYKLGRDGDGFSSPISYTNREALTLDTEESDACLEKFVCQLLLHYGGSKIIGKKTTFEILRELNVKPLVVPVPYSSFSQSQSGRKARKVWKCSSLKCNWDGNG